MAKKKAEASKEKVEEVVEAQKEEKKSKPKSNLIQSDGNIYEIKGDKIYKGDVEVDKPERVAYLKSLA